MDAAAVVVVMGKILVEVFIYQSSLVAKPLQNLSLYNISILVFNGNWQTLPNWWMYADDHNQNIKKWCIKFHIYIFIYLLYVYFCLYDCAKLSSQSMTL